MNNDEKESGFRSQEQDGSTPSKETPVLQLQPLQGGEKPTNKPVPGSPPSMAPPVPTGLLPPVRPQVPPHSHQHATSTSVQRPIVASAFSAPYSHSQPHRGPHSSKPVPVMHSVGQTMPRPLPNVPPSRHQGNLAGKPYHMPGSSQSTSLMVPNPLSTTSTPAPPPMYPSAPRQRPHMPGAPYSVVLATNKRPPPPPLAAPLNAATKRARPDPEIHVNNQDDSIFDDPDVTEAKPKPFSSPPSKKKKTIRTVPSPVAGFPYVNYPMPMLEYTFPSNLKVCRNPYHSSYHRLHGRRRTREGLPKKIVLNNDSGVFGDAIVKEPPKPPTPPPSPPDAGTVIDDDDEFVPLGSQAGPLKKKKKKPSDDVPVVQKRIPISQQNFTAPKEIAFAKKTMAGLLDLSLALPMEQADWLGREQWIFTIQQLQFVIHNSTYRDALCETLAKSPLVQDKKDLPAEKTSDEATITAKPEDGNSGTELSTTETSTIPTADARMPESDNPTSSAAATKPDEESAPQSISPPSPALLARARQMVEEWKTILVKKRGDLMGRSAGSWFSLKGPVSTLLPTLVKQFLETAQVKTAYGFLALKKTEASPLINVYQDWRRHCELQYAKGYNLARHLVGLTTRFETALTSVPPADQYTRKWMGTVLVTLTGGSKDFIIGECHLNDVHHFLGERTKSWSDRLVTWRERNNLPPLRGSGKVAMVSGWKTSLKEALDVERGVGRVLSEAEMLKPPPDDGNSALYDAPKKKSSRKSSKKPVASSGKPVLRFTDGNEALQSAEFLRTVLKDDNTRFLNSVGIHTPEQLIEADKQQSSPIITKLVKFRSEVTSTPAQLATCVRLMYDWTQKVKSKIEEIQTDCVKPLAKKRGPRPKDDGDGLDTGSSSPGGRTRSRASRKTLEDPMDALSATTKSFLETIGITSGEQFLSTKTSSISRHYVNWRTREKMPQLKGFGAIATVSGWKAQIRKAATDAGDHDLASTAPEDRYTKEFRSTTPPPGEVSASLKLTTPKNLFSNHPGILCGLPVRRFLVRCIKDKDVLFRFELSVRKESFASQEFKVFLTYKGYGNKSIVKKDAKHPAEVCNDTYPLMLDQPDLSTDDACNDFSEGSQVFLGDRHGPGFIDVGKYGAIPLRSDAEMESLCQTVYAFLMNGESRLEDLMKSDQVGNTEQCNVHKRFSDAHGVQHLFFLDGALERGQSIELRFGGSMFLGNPQYVTGPAARATIRSAMHGLSIRDLNRIISGVRKLQENSTQAVLQSCQVDRDIYTHRLRWFVSVVESRLGEFETEMKRSDKPRAVSQDAIGRLRRALAGLNDDESREIDKQSDSFVADLRSGILEDLASKSASGLPFNASAYCEKASKELLHHCVDDVVRHRVAQENDDLTSKIMSRIQTFAEVFFASFSDKSYGIFQLSSRKVMAVGDDVDSVEFVEPENGLLNVKWYLQTQVVDFMISLSESGAEQRLRANNRVFSTNDVVSTLVAAAVAKSVDDPEKKTPVAQRLQDFISNPGLRIESPTTRRRCAEFVVAPQARFSGETPAAVSIFLGCLWPRLQRKYGWRLEAGSSPREMVFIPPGKNKRVRRLYDKTTKIRQERIQKRARIDTRMNEIGVGYIQKMTKRTFVKIDEGNGNNDHSDGMCAKETLELFLNKMQPANVNSDEQWRLRSIVDSITTCFDEIMPLLATSSPSGLTSEKLGSDKLLQVLMIIPSMLHQSGLPFRQIEDTVGVIRDLIRFITDNFQTVLDEQFQPLVEEYAKDEQRTEAFLTPRLSTLAVKSKGVPTTASSDDATKDTSNKVTEDADLIRDLILPEDVPDLTDFTVTAMRQFVPCRATQKDVGKKGRRMISVGYPGMVCKHCWGAYGEGKYFFSSLDSLGTAAGVVYSHLIKCPKLAVEERKKLTSYKARHSDDRKTLKFGSQSAYFSRLWKRLHSATTVGNSGVYVVQQDGDDKKAQHIAEEMDTLQRNPNEPVFGSHHEVIDFLINSPTYLEKSDIHDGLETYYKCLEYGGKVVGTSSAPRNFNSEWLLAKMLPSDALRKKRVSVGI